MLPISHLETKNVARLSELPTELLFYGGSMLPLTHLIVIRRVSGRCLLTRFSPNQQWHNGRLASEQEKSGEQGYKGE